jgi:hypothetical protein
MRAQRAPKDVPRPDAFASSRSGAQDKGRLGPEGPVKFFLFRKKFQIALGQASTVHTLENKGTEKLVRPEGPNSAFFTRLRRKRRLGFPTAVASHPAEHFLL